jgi:hypothetical protein
VQIINLAKREQTTTSFECSPATYFASGSTAAKNSFGASIQGKCPLFSKTTKSRASYSFVEPLRFFNRANPVAELRYQAKRCGSHTCHGLHLR